MLCGAVVAQWIRPRTLNGEVPSSNLLAAAVVPLGKALYPHCLVPRKGLKTVDPLVACLYAACFLSGQVKINPTIVYSYYNASKQGSDSIQEHPEPLSGPWTPAV